MELLGNVGLDWIEPQDRRCYPREGEEIFGHRNIRLTEDRIAEGDVDTEALSVELSG